MHKLLSCILAANLMAAGILSPSTASAASPATQGAVSSSLDGADASSVSLTGQAVEKKAGNIEGFRSAKFGMTEKQVRKAIVQDFEVNKADISKDVHPLERTTILLVPVTDLLPRTGSAVVAYIFGFKSKRLMQVNVVWGNNGGKRNIGQLGAVLIALRNYFSGMAFQPESLARDLPLADGTVLAFRGADTKGRMVTLIGQGLTAVPYKNGKIQKPDPGKAGVQLSYIATPRAPDIFRVGEGDF